MHGLAKIAQYGALVPESVSCKVTVPIIKPGGSPLAEVTVVNAPVQGPPQEIHNFHNEPSAMLPLKAESKLITTVPPS